MTIEGSCHCRAVTHSLASLPNEAIECNCSICRRKGYQLAFVSPGAFHLEIDPAVLASYGFGSHAIRHLFCRQCGCAPFCEGSGPDWPMMAIDLRCLDAADLSAIEISQVDGASL